MSDDDELQTGADVSESPDVEADLAPASEETQTQSEVDEQSSQETVQDKDPRGYTKAIHKKHHQLMEEKRRREAVEQELQRLRSQLPEEQRPVIPEMPDPYDIDFTERMAEREKAIQSMAAYEARQQLQQQLQEQQKQQQLQEQQRQQQQRDEAFSKRAKATGISDVELGTAIQTIAAYGGIGNELANFIMENENGPEIVAHLARNPEEILTLNEMGALQGAVHVSSVLQPRAASTKRNVNTPPPPDSLGGGGAPPADIGPPGATYE